MLGEKNRNMVAGKVVLTVAGFLSVLISGYIMLHAMLASLNDDTPSFAFGLTYSVAALACGVIALRSRNREKTVIIDVFLPAGLTAIIFIVWLVFNFVTGRYDGLAYFLLENLIVASPLVLMFGGAVLRAKGIDEQELQGDRNSNQR